MFFHNCTCIRIHEPNLSPTHKRSSAHACISLCTYTRTHIMQDAYPENNYLKLAMETHGRVYIDPPLPFRVRCLDMDLPQDSPELSVMVVVDPIFSGLQEFLKKIDFMIYQTPVLFISNIMCCFVVSLQRNCAKHDHFLRSFS